jgi:Flp pilus assembly pilin Flp
MELRGLYRPSIHSDLHPIISTTGDQSPYHMERIEQLIRNDSGQDVAEYGLLVAGVGLLVLIGVTSLGANLHTWFGGLATRVTANVGG